MPGKKLAIPRPITWGLVAGICFSLLLILAAPASAAEAVIIGSYVNLRSGPNTTSAKISVTVQGTRFPIVGSQGDWYQLQLADGSTAWAAGWLLQVIDTPAANSNVLTIKVAGSYANLRSGPGTNYSLLGKASANQTFTVLDQSGDWYKIESAGRTAWIANWVVEPVNGNTEPVETAQPEATGQTIAVITVGYANIRSGPGTDTAILGTYKQGTNLTVINKSGDWYQVNFADQKTGWIAGWLVDVRAPETPSRGETGELPAAETPPATETPAVQKPAVPAVLKDVKIKVIATDHLTFSVSASEALDFDLVKSSRQVVLSFKNADKTSANIKNLTVRSNKLVDKVRYYKPDKNGIAQLVIDLKRPVIAATSLLSGSQTGLQLDLTAPSLKGRTIVIDPGHGGTDSGAVGVTGLKEKDFNLDAAQRLSRLLTDLGAKVIMTRTTDVLIPLEDIPAVPNSRKPDLFISIHANAMQDNPDVNGTITYYYITTEAGNRSLRDELSLKLAADVHKAVMQELRLVDKGTRQSPGRGYLVLRECQVPCILLETAFLSNPADEAQLKSDSFRQRTAEAIAAGLADYFDNIKSTAYDNNN